MLNQTEILAREIIIEQLTKQIEKAEKKANKEKAKRDSAYITYKGERYETEQDLSDAYACDVFSSSIYDKLLERLNNARGKIDRNEMTPTEQLIIELNKIRENFRTELKMHYWQQDEKERKEKRYQELQEQGYSFREAETIIGNEELMRYE